MFQEKPVQLINASLGADVLSTSCPLYAEYQGNRPIGIERYRKHVIDKNPDLLIISYGYNDVRAGTPIDDFRRDLETMLKAIVNETDALIVLMNTYAIPTPGYTSKSGGSISGSSWDKGNRETHTLYNLLLNDVAEEQGHLFVDVHSTQVRSPWTCCSPDGSDDIHANDLGHRLIAHRLFEALAPQCSFLSLKPQKARKKVGRSPWRYGTDSPETQLIADFYPDSPELTKYKKKPARRSRK